METTIDIRSIIIPYDIRNSIPSEDKLNRIREYYKRTGTIDRPIIISKDRVLIDNYIRYIVALENDMIKVPCLITQGSKVEEKTITLVVGKFPNNDKEYIWRVPFNKPMDIQIGDKVLVNINYRGKRRKKSVTVVNVYKSNDYQMRKHNCVVKVIKKGIGVDGNAP